MVSEKTRYGLATDELGTTDACAKALIPQS